MAAVEVAVFVSTVYTGYEALLCLREIYCDTPREACRRLVLDALLTAATFGLYKYLRWIGVAPVFGRLLPNLLRRLSGKAAGKADDAWRWARGVGDDAVLKATDRTYHSVYSDGTLVIKGQQSARIPHSVDLVNPAPRGRYSRVRYDEVNQRVYQLREFDAEGNLVRDLDMTTPTFPNSRSRPGHSGTAHQHRYHVNDPRVGPRSGFKRGGPEPLETLDGGF